MKLAQDKLTELAQKAYRANSRMLSASDYLRSVNLPDPVADDLSAARQALVSIGHGLVSLGAEDPHRAAWTETDADLRAAGYDVPERHETPLHLLSSEKAKAAARKLREAAEAVLAMEAERGLSDGLGEMLSDWADIQEMEAFGPVGLGERD
jgi:hypothetical protein